MLHDHSRRSGRQTQRELLTPAKKAAVGPTLHSIPYKAVLTVCSSSSTIEHALARQHSNESSHTLSANRVCGPARQQSDEERQVVSLRSLPQLLSIDLS